MTAAQRLQLFWVAATSMRDSPASGLAAPSADVFRCFPNRLLASSSRLYGASQQHALAPSFTRPTFFISLVFLLTHSFFAPAAAAELLLLKLLRP